MVHAARTRTAGIGIGEEGSGARRHAESRERRGGAEAIFGSGRAQVLLDPRLDAPVAGAREREARALRDGRAGLRKRLEGANGAGCSGRSVRGRAACDPGARGRRRAPRESSSPRRAFGSRRAARARSSGSLRHRLQPRRAASRPRWSERAGRSRPASPRRLASACRRTAAAASIAPGPCPAATRTRSASWPPASQIAGDCPRERDVLAKAVVAARPEVAQAGRPTWPPGVAGRAAMARTASVRTMGSGSRRAASPSAVEVRRRRRRRARRAPPAGARAGRRRRAREGARRDRPGARARATPTARQRGSGSCAKTRASSRLKPRPAIRASAASAPAASCTRMRSASASSSSCAQGSASRTRSGAVGGRRGAQVATGHLAGDRRRVAVRRACRRSRAWRSRRAARR